MVPGLLDLVDPVEGFLAPDEIALLSQMTELASRGSGSFVEVGSFHGRSTVTIAATLRHLGDLRRLVAIDPHQGDLGLDSTGDGHHTVVAPSLDGFRVNLEARALTQHVEPITARFVDVDLTRFAPIRFAFIDALHDLESVRADFAHLEPALAPGAIVLFHDYAMPVWGVTEVVDGLLASGRYGLLARSTCLVAIRGPL